METVGARVRRLRKTIGLNQQELARACGVDQSTISDIERGANTQFSGKVLIKMADALQSTPYYVMQGGEDRAMSEAELLRAFRRVDPDAQAALLRMANALAAQTTIKIPPHDTQ